MLTERVGVWWGGTGHRNDNSGSSGQTPKGRIGGGGGESGEKDGQTTKGRIHREGYRIDEVQIGERKSGDWQG